MFRAAGVALLRGAGAAVRSATGAAKKAPAEKAARAPASNAALTRKYEVSPALSEFMGAEEVTRQEVTAKVWQYIRTNNLQNPEKKAEVLPDATLRKVLDADVLTFGLIAKLLAEHFPKSTKPKTTRAPRVKKATTKEKKTEE